MSLSLVLFFAGCLVRPIDGLRSPPTPGILRWATGSSSASLRSSSDDHDASSSSTFSSTSTSQSEASADSSISSSAPSFDNDVLGGRGDASRRPTSRSTTTTPSIHLRPPQERIFTRKICSTSSSTSRDPFEDVVDYVHDAVVSSNASWYTMSAGSNKYRVAAPPSVTLPTTSLTASSTASPTALNLMKTTELSTTTKTSSTTPPRSTAPSPTALVKRKRSFVTSPTTRGTTTAAPVTLTAHLMSGKALTAEVVDYDICVDDVRPRLEKLGNLLPGQRLVLSSGFASGQHHYGQDVPDGATATPTAGGSSPPSASPSSSCASQDTPYTEVVPPLMLSPQMSMSPLSGYEPILNLFEIRLQDSDDDGTGTEDLRKRTETTPVVVDATPVALDAQEGRSSRKVATQINSTDTPWKKVGNKAASITTQPSLEQTLSSETREDIIAGKTDGAGASSLASPQSRGTTPPSSRPKLKKKSVFFPPREGAYTLHQGKPLLAVVQEHADLQPGQPLRTRLLTAVHLARDDVLRDILEEAFSEDENKISGPRAQALFLLSLLNNNVKAVAAMLRVAKKEDELQQSSSDSAGYLHDSTDLKSSSSRKTGRGHFQTLLQESSSNAVMDYMKEQVEIIGDGHGVGDQVQLHQQQPLSFSIDTWRPDIDELADAPPLAVAAFCGHAGMVEKLLDFGADVHARNIWGLTALHHASRQLYVDVVSLLVARGASARNADNMWHATPRNFIAGRQEYVSTLAGDGLLGLRNTDEDVWNYGDEERVDDLHNHDLHINLFVPEADAGEGLSAVGDEGLELFHNEDNILRILRRTRGEEGHTGLDDSTEEDAIQPEQLEEHEIENRRDEEDGRHVAGRGVLVLPEREDLVDAVEDTTIDPDRNRIEDHEDQQMTGEEAVEDVLRQFDRGPVDQAEDTVANHADLFRMQELNRRFLQELPYKNRRELMSHRERNRERDRQPQNDDRDRNIRRLQLQPDNRGRDGQQPAHDHQYRRQQDGTLQYGLEQYLVRFLADEERSKRRNHDQGTTIAALLATGSAPRIPFQRARLLRFEPDGLTLPKFRAEAILMHAEAREG
ncbi:unnamed protein product [Amoebophrya sp. A25]|nr:unnamed protein product [Amoebophrya sp. A25]|eukprot:GSA25T00024452001.1